MIIAVTEFHQINACASQIMIQRKFKLFHAIHIDSETHLLLAFRVADLLTSSFERSVSQQEIL